MLWDLLKQTLLTPSLRGVSSLVKGAAEGNRRLQTQSLTLTHLDKVGFLALGRFGMFARQVPCCSGTCLLPHWRQGGGLCMAVAPETSGCPCALSHWELTLCSSLQGELTPVPFGAGTMRSGTCFQPAHL